uniref:Uncharacterized protein n=1 Tax=viral metagenome TaxID=1070528 RepID=A0A6C0C736_9ZZZZ
MIKYLYIQISRQYNSLPATLNDRILGGSNLLAIQFLVGDIQQSNIGEFASHGNID